MRRRRLGPVSRAFYPGAFYPPSRASATCSTPLPLAERGTVRGVEQKVWTAAELEKLSPAERHALFDASVVTDLGQAPQDLIERTRARIHQRIAQTKAQRG